LDGHLGKLWLAGKLHASTPPAQPDRIPARITSWMWVAVYALGKSLSDGQSPKMIPTFESFLLFLQKPSFYNAFN